MGFYHVDNLIGFLKTYDEGDRRIENLQILLELLKRRAGVVQEEIEELNKKRTKL